MSFNFPFPKVMYSYEDVMSQLSAFVMYLDNKYPSIKNSPVTIGSYILDGRFIDDESIDSSYVCIDSFIRDCIIDIYRNHHAPFSENAEKLSLALMFDVFNYSQEIINLYSWLKDIPQEYRIKNKD